MTDAKRWLDVDVVALVSAQILVDARRGAARRSHRRGWSQGTDGTSRRASGCATEAIRCAAASSAAGAVLKPLIANDAAYGTRRIRALVTDRANGEDES